VIFGSLDAIMNYVECVTFVQKYFTVGSPDETMMNLHLY